MSAQVPAKGAWVFARADRGRWQKIWLLFVLLFALSWLGFSAWRLDYVADDAVIVFRHVQNHARGLGMVYDGWQRVQGYSSPLWAWLLRLGLALGVSPSLAARGLGLLSAVACAGLLAWQHRAMSRRWSCLLLGLVLSFGPLVLWAAAGLETLLATAVTLAFVASATHPARALHRFASLLAVTSGLVRPDLPLQLLAGLLGVWLIDRSLRTRLTVLLLAAGLGIAVPLLLGRLLYASGLASPIVAKLQIEPRNALRMLRYVFTDAPQLLIPYALALVLFVRDRRAFSLRDRLGLCIGLATLGELTLLGGDELARGRFLITPFLLALSAVVSVAARARISLPPVAWVLLWLGVLGQGVVALRPEGDRSCGLWRAAAGRWLASHTAQDFPIAVAAAGYTPYYAERPTVDLMGLCHAEIAALPVPRGGKAWGQKATEIAFAQGVCAVVLAVCESPREDPRVWCPHPTLAGMVAALMARDDVVFVQADLGIGNPLRLAVRTRCLSKIWGVSPPLSSASTETWK